jgi:hypothetical protein
MEVLQYLDSISNNQSLSIMSDFFVIPDLQISHVPQYTPDFQLIETSNPNILNQTPDFMDRR